jgi:hypothetical protein
MDTWAKHKTNSTTSSTLAKQFSSLLWSLCSSVIFTQSAHVTFLGSNKTRLRRRPEIYMYAPAPLFFSFSLFPFWVALTFFFSYSELCAFPPSSSSSPCTFPVSTLFSSPLPSPPNSGFCLSPTDLLFSPLMRRGSGSFVGTRIHFWLTLRGRLSLTYRQPNTTKQLT